MKLPFIPASRYPADPRAVFVLALCVASGIPLVFGATDSESLEQVLPVWAVSVWGVLLVVGAVASLAGMARQTDMGIIVEQVGSVIVGAATAYYSAAMIVASGTFPPSIAIVLAWGLSCFWRWGQLQSLINQRIIERAAEQIKKELT